jgi:hypothetical protein
MREYVRVVTKDYIGNWPMRQCPLPWAPLETMRIHRANRFFSCSLWTNRNGFSSRCTICRFGVIVPVRVFEVAQFLCESEKQICVLAIIFTKCYKRRWTYP